MAEAAEPMGYIISHDEYCGRDDVGIVYQLNVAPLRQRHLIGASLVKAAFERAAYGCRLFSCWCAQDIQANFFWESIGFVPLAFRTGTRAKQRTHIFWQKRVREGDEATPWWFPSQTTSGAFREDRLVFPIPVGMHWRDPMPVVLPPLPEAPTAPAGPLTLPGGALVRPRPERPTVSAARKVAIVRSQSKTLQGLPPGKAAVITGGGIRYLERADYVPEPEPAKITVCRRRDSRFSTNGARWSATYPSWIARPARSPEAVSVTSAASPDGGCTGPACGSAVEPGRSPRTSRNSSVRLAGRRSSSHSWKWVGESWRILRSAAKVLRSGSARA